MSRASLLRGATAEELKRPEYRELTPKEKRQNWWHYHWGMIVGLVILAAILFSLLYSIFSKVDPDYRIAVMVSYSMPEHGRTELERCITPYADDRNGDGKVVVEVNTYELKLPSNPTSEQVQMQQAHLTRFLVDFSENASMIVLHDADSFVAMGDDMQGLFLYNDGTPMPEEATDFENAMRSWSDLAAFASFEPISDDENNVPSAAFKASFEQLRVSFRAAEGTSIENSEKDMAYHADCLRLYNRLLTGELPEQE